MIQAWTLVLLRSTKHKINRKMGDVYEDILHMKKKFIWAKHWFATGSKVWTIGRLRNCLDAPSCSKSLWQGWSCGLVHCPGGNATDPIWRVLASSRGISSWTPLKPQHSNPYPNLNSFGQSTVVYWLPLLIPHLSFSLTDFPATRAKMTVHKIKRRWLITR